MPLYPWAGGQACRHLLVATCLFWLQARDGHGLTLPLRQGIGCRQKRDRVATDHFDSGHQGRDDCMGTDGWSQRIYSYVLQLRCHAKDFKMGRFETLHLTSQYKGHNLCWWDQCSAALEKQWVRSSNLGHSFVALRSPQKPRFYVHRTKKWTEKLFIVNKSQNTSYSKLHWTTRNLGESSPESLAKDLLAWALFQKMLQRIVSLTTACCTLVNCKEKLFSFYVNLI